MNDFNRGIIEEFRANGGTVTSFRPGGSAGAAAPSLLLLTTTGAKTGRRHTTPLAYLADGDRLLVFASKAGAPNHPDWYHNLVANPRVTVEVGSESFKAAAAVLERRARDAIFARQAERAPQFAEYQARTTRVIPVVALTRVI